MVGAGILQQEDGAIKWSAVELIVTFMIISPYWSWVIFIHGNCA
jgi:hypothetical protein